MSGTVLIDAGPLAALLNPKDAHYSWALRMAQRLEPPLLTSEPVLAEAFHLLRRGGCEGDELFALVETGLVGIGLRFESEWLYLRRLMLRNRKAPMSLADASLVRMSELHRNCRIFTLNANFRIYRRYGNRPIPLIIPWE